MTRASKRLDNLEHRIIALTEDHLDDYKWLSARLNRLENPPKPEKLHGFKIHFRDPRQSWQTVKAVKWLDHGFFYSFMGADGETVLTVRADEVLAIRDEGEIEE